MTTYEDVGQVAGLVAGTPSTPGTPIPGGDAVSDGDVNTVWNNSTVDGQFGVTSPLTVEDLSATTAKVLASETLQHEPGRHQLQLEVRARPQHRADAERSGRDLNGLYARRRGLSAIDAGMLDVSNADSTSYIDTTNAASQFYKGAYADYAFNRSVVAVSANGSYSITPTLAYGGDNSRAAVLAPNGLYYTVGNSNSGTTTAPELTTTTGLEVVTPGSTQNSKMIDPSFKTYPADKAGKDQQLPRVDLLRRQPLFHQGQRQQRRRHGLYRQQPEWPAADRGDRQPSATISILPGFPTDSAKTGADYTPFGLFFANPDTLYVADEGGRPGAERRSREMDTVERDLASGLYVAERPDRRNLHRRWVAD